MVINFRQLEVFRAVAETHSFTRASHTLFISQSTVSQHIRELEDALKVQLFSRNRRNVALTQAGESLLEYGRNIFQMLDDAETAVRTVRDPFSGKLSFGCASTTLLYHLPVILEGYAAKYPNVELNITAGTIQDVASAMLSGALDLGLVVLPLSSPALDKTLLFEEAFALVVSSGHRLAHEPRLKIQDVAGERFILHRQGQNTRKLVDRYLFRQHITPRVAIELAETEAIKAMVVRGLGVSILPQSAFQSEGAMHGLRIFPIARKELSRSLAVVSPRGKQLRPATAAMIGMLQEHFRSRNRSTKTAAQGVATHR